MQTCEETLTLFHYNIRGFAFKRYATATVLEIEYEHIKKKHGNFSMGPRKRNMARSNETNQCCMCFHNISWHNLVLF